MARIPRVKIDELDLDALDLSEFDLDSLDLGELKALLARLSAAEDTDYDTILAISHKIAEFDDERVRFTVDASHIDRLGRELVARQETAVAELVKNAYDADAFRVTLLFEDALEPGGTLRITDNGHGMTRAELINGFMRLSTQDKIDNPESRKYGRKKAGRKGIGRFATQRLGSSLVLKTQTLRPKKALQIEINWAKYKGHEEIFLISNDIEEIDLFQPKPGTVLEIRGLRDGWSDEQIRRTYRYIANLLQPFPLSKRKRAPTGKRSRDPGFKSKFVRVDNKKRKNIADEESTFFEHALAVFDAYVDESGKGFWSVESKKLGMDIQDRRVGPDKGDPSQPFAHLKDIYLRAYYFLEDEDNPYPRKSRTIIRNVLQQFGGIRLYRNGFRVPPYGDEGDDWLDLDKSYRRRLILPQHGNNNFLGFIELQDPDEHSFGETSSREGLLQTDAFHELTNFGYSAITAAVVAVAEERGVKTKPSKPTRKSPEEHGEEIAKRLTNLAKSEPNPKTKKVYENVAKQVRNMVVDVQEQFDEQVNELSMLRVLAAMGLSIGEFTHEARFLVESLGNGLQVLKDKKTTARKQMQIIENLDDSYGTLRSYVSYFDRAVTENAHRFTKAEELRDVVGEFEDAIETWLSDRNIELNTEFDGYDLYATPMHPSEWSSIFMNLCSNAVKAINRKGGVGKILIESGEADEKVCIEFSDTGDGIKDEHREHIFNAFFTTTGPAGARDNPETELVGTGLGLKIVRDIVTSYRGTIELVPPPEGYATCFRIELPRADEDEIANAS